MENIYQNAIRAVEDGANFQIDFRSRSLKLDGKFIIRNGESEGDLGVLKCNSDEFLTNVEKLYYRYKNSDLRNVAKARLVDILGPRLKKI